MGIDEKMLLIRNYDLWCNLSEEEYDELNIKHHFIEVPKGEYIYFEAYNHNKIYFLKEGYIKIGYIDEEGNEKIKEIIKKGELFGQFKLRNIENRLVNLLNKDVKTRLLHFLWQLVEQQLGETRPEGFCIPNYLTHEDIASLIGSSRQTVTTMINELEHEGILSFNRQQICFLDVKKLQKRITVT